MPPFHTKCRYHVQDGTNLCGAAAAMMILAQQGQSLDTLAQGTLNGPLVRNAPLGVATTPNNLADVLNSQFPDRFRVVTASSAADVARHAVQSVMQDVPSAVPIYSDSHWTVVEGIETNVTPALNQPYEISAVWVHNPTTTPVNGVPPHGATDDCMLIGPGIVAVRHHYGAWLSLVGQPKDDFRFKCVTSAVPINIGFPSAPSAPPPIVPSFNGSLAEETLLNILRSDGFGNSEIVSRLSPSGLVRTKSLGLVRSLAEDISDYYLVSVVDDRGIIGLAEIDAKRPWLRSLGILGCPLEKIIPDTQEILHALLQAQLPGLPSDSGSWWHSQLQSARLVWRPCNESSSPYIPFLAVPLGSNLEPQRHAFVRTTIEKSVFRELTDPLQGG
jgi:hypothetical protein